MEPNPLFEMMADDRLATLETGQAMTAWGRELMDLLASLTDGQIDQPGPDGRTALARLAGNREAWKSVESQGLQSLLAAGANPLAGAAPAITQANPFTDNAGFNLMMQALVDAQLRNAPYHCDNGGNVLHVLAQSNLGSLAHIVSTRLALDLPARVMALWRDEPRAVDGLSPVALAWSRPHDGRSNTALSGVSFALWRLLQPWPSWVPPDLEGFHGGDEPLWQLVKRVAPDGMSGLPQGAEGVRDHIMALEARSKMQNRTIGAGGRSRGGARL